MCKARQSSWYSTFCVWHWQEYSAWTSFRWEEMFISLSGLQNGFWDFCDPFGMNVRLLEKSLCINAKACQLTLIFLLSVLFFLPPIPFFPCLFCWGDYPIEKVGFSVELGIARKLGSSHLARCLSCCLIRLQKEAPFLWDVLCVSALCKGEVTGGAKRLSCFR